MMRKIIPFLCILLGIALALYPTVKDRYESYQQQRILEQWQDNFQQIEEVTPEAVALENLDINQTPQSKVGEEMPVPSIEPVKVKTVSPEQIARAAYMEKHVEGVLSIAKINLKLPILKNATQKNLALSLASIANTGKAGAIGNYAIAGHRNFSYGKNFNRLDEVEVGDIIEVDTGKKQYKYKISDKKYVLPTDVEVLEGNGKDSEITLITCHPMKNPTHRLVVVGKLIVQKD